MVEATASQVVLRELPLRMGQHLFQTVQTHKSCNTEEGTAFASQGNGSGLSACLCVCACPWRLQPPLRFVK